MVSCLDIVTLAMRQARVIAMGETPSDDEGEAGLEALRGLYEQWFVGGMFGQLTDSIEASSFTAEPNQRIRHDGSITVTLPTEVDDDGDIYPPYDLSIIEVFDTSTGEMTRSIYDASAGGWITLGEIELTDDAPLASRGRDGLAACLAISFAEMFGSNIGPGVAMRARGFKMALSMKLGADRPRASAEYF